MDKKYCYRADVNNGDMARYTYEEAVALYDEVKGKKSELRVAIKNGWLPENPTFLSTPTLFNLWREKDISFGIPPLSRNELYAVVDEVLKLVKKAQSTAERAERTADHAKTEAIYAGYTGF